MAATVRDLVKIKGDEVWSVGPEARLLQALELMAEHNVGALVVLEGGEVSGIISERDFARGVARMGQCLIEMPVKEIMTRTVVTVNPDMTTEECMGLMTEKKIRHLPVLVEGRLVGLVSIGDVVRDLISSRELTIHTLENYIGGTDYNR